MKAVDRSQRGLEGKYSSRDVRKFWGGALFESESSVSAANRHTRAGLVSWFKTRDAVL